MGGGAADAPAALRAAVAAVRELGGLLGRECPLYYVWCPPWIGRRRPKTPRRRRDCGVARVRRRRRAHTPTAGCRAACRRGRRGATPSPSTASSSSATPTTSARRAPRAQNDERCGIPPTGWRRGRRRAPRAAAELPAPFASSGGGGGGGRRSSWRDSSSTATSLRPRSAFGRVHGVVLASAAAPAPPAAAAPAITAAAAGPAPLPQEWPFFDEVHVRDRLASNIDQFTRGDALVRQEALSRVRAEGTATGDGEADGGVRLVGECKGSHHEVYSLELRLNRRPLPLLAYRSCTCEDFKGRLAAVGANEDDEYQGCLCKHLLALVLRAARDAAPAPPVSSNAAPAAAAPPPPPPAAAAGPSGAAAPADGRRGRQSASGPCPDSASERPRRRRRRRRGLPRPRRRRRGRPRPRPPAPRRRRRGASRRRRRLRRPPRRPPTSEGPRRFGSR